MQNTSEYFDTTVKDYYVRGDAKTAVAAIDLTNNSAEKNGQDWFVY